MTMQMSVELKHQLNALERALSNRARWAHTAR